jgi:hypothetical protein
MGTIPPLLTYLLLVVSGWVHRHQLVVIELLQAENALLKARLRGKRIRFTDAERALLARKAKAVGRKALLTLDTLVSPDTLMRWHRRLVAQKNGTLHIVVARAGRVSCGKSRRLFYVWQRRIPAGATRGYKGPWPI